MVTRNAAVITVVVCFFLAVIFIYYNMLYTQTRENIIRSSELNAVKSANQIEKYLQTGVDVILISGYTIDTMLQSNKSNDKIHDFMKSQNYTASSIVNEQVNGIYGYIRGEFINGVGWTPYHGYDPTNRSWYKGALENVGKVAIVDPYHDARTGAMMVTMSKALSDAKSVIAFDISVDRLQKVTEDVAKEGNSDLEIVLDSRYKVIAHSDKREVGRYYSQDDGSFGSAVVSTLNEKAPGENHFLMDYRGKRYIIYAIEIENDWLCLSINDATNEFDSLRFPLAVTVIISLLFIVVLIIIMVRSFRKERLATEMKRLADKQSEIARIDQMTGLKNRRAYAETLDRLSRDLPDGTKVVVFDLNGLKETNDQYGHEAGDSLITAAADCLRSSFEGVDDIFRIGGDEFCLITTMSDEEVTKCLNKLAVVSAGCKGKHINGVSISSGIGTDREHAHIESIVREADKNMYKQKQDYYNTADHDRRAPR